MINDFIKDNDYKSTIDLLSDKKEIAKEIRRDIILDNVDDIWQFVMEKAYKKWGQDKTDREEYIECLSEYEKVAVIFGNFNYQVENGGLIQWDDNGYSEDYDFIYDFLEKSTYEKKQYFIGILDSFDNVKRSIENLDWSDDWFEDDKQTRLNSLNDFDNDYYNLKESWKDYLENYLIDNIPDDYMELIRNMNLSVNTI